MFSIHSTTSSRELVFSDLKGEYFSVELKGQSVSALNGVWAYTDTKFLNGLFQELGEYDTPWQGQRSWTSIEEEFRIAATCTSMGSVIFEVELCGLQGEPEEWRVKAGLVTEFGQLVQIAKRAAEFFNAPDT